MAAMRELSCGCEMGQGWQFCPYCGSRIVSTGMLQGWCHAYTRTTGTLCGRKSWKPTGKLCRRHWQQNHRRVSRARIAKRLASSDSR